MTDDELLRYSRQILLPDFDVEGQERLRQSHALVIGLGALGLLVLAGTAAVALSDMSHSRFQKVHGPLAGVAFLVLTLHAAVAAATGHGHGAVTTTWTPTGRPSSARPRKISNSRECGPTS